ncbi:hypothetical protein BS50DRAFT_615717 [Corynespora cassiicola Philippines]|uniref:Exonuclease domain-containing protein n=1 Tax=Corynespora cassiicola Philippines TaxID=1448308 RepID=A0A2T2PBB8_CORCC|nr:hypothetical protein BS50DRAFT_615717 [Corynespora cassiicola Philippines]
MDPDPNHLRQLEYLTELQKLVLPKGRLPRHGYVTQPLTDQELASKRQCIVCGKSVSKNSNKSDGDPTMPIRKMKCRYHLEGFFNRTWQCCGKGLKAMPCCADFEHTPRRYEDGELGRLHQFHRTPFWAPSFSSLRDAVALDCEMGTSIYGTSEVLRVTLIDYFTGQVLINNLVDPGVPIANYNSRFSGVNERLVEEATREGTCIFGCENARFAIWNFVGPQTIVVGQSVDNDLRALRWIHDRVIDSFVLFSLRRRNELDQEDVRKLNVLYQGCQDQVANGLVEARKQRGRLGGLSLKALAKLHLERDIQMSDNGHDSLEDALAARDLIHLNMSSPALVANLQILLATT